jgi:DNA modification methylase
MRLPINDVIVSDAIALLKQLGNNSAPLIIADTPYGIGYHSNHYKGKNPHAPVTNDWNFQIGSFLRECQRVLVGGGALYLFSRWDVYPLWLPAIKTHEALTLKTKIVWVKNNWSAGDLEGCFGNQYEEILFIVKGRHLLRGKRWPNIWPFDRVPSTQLLHPTQKPTPLLQRAIEASSDPGDLVIDPFAGSGSTGEAAKLSGRSFLLGDIDPKMVNIARVRLGLPLLNLDEEQAVPLSEYSFELPDPAEWGIHPEELRYLYDSLQGKVNGKLKQLPLVEA